MVETGRQWKLGRGPTGPTTMEQPGNLPFLPRYVSNPARRAVAPSLPTVSSMSWSNPNSETEPFSRETAPQRESLSRPERRNHKSEEINPWISSTNPCPISAWEAEASPPPRPQVHPPRGPGPSPGPQATGRSEGRPSKPPAAKDPRENRFAGRERR